MRAAFFAFALSRLLVVFIFVLSTQLRITPGTKPWEAGAASLRIRGDELVRIARQHINTADANWYIGIASEGYAHRPFSTDTHHNWAFFPLYPLMLRAVAKMTGEMVFTGVALSSLLLLPALVLLHKAALAFGFAGEDADRATFYAAVFPVSYFFSLPLTESLFFALTIGSFLAARRDIWWAAGLLGALASATRVTGVLLLPALLVLHFQQHGRTWNPRLLWLSLVPAGMLIYMGFLHRITGNAFAFKDIEVAWGRKPRLFYRPLLDYLRAPLVVARPWDFRLLNCAAILTAMASGIVLLRCKQWALAGYTLCVVLVTLSSGLLQSQARYAMTVFPMFFALAVFGRRRLVDRTISAVSLVLLALMTALFAQQVDIALS